MSSHSLHQKLYFNSIMSSKFIYTQSHLITQKPRPFGIEDIQVQHLNPEQMSRGYLQHSMIWGNYFVIKHLFKTI